MLWWLEKVGFPTDWASPQPLKKVKCLKTRAFLNIFKGPRRKIMPPLRSFLKVSKIMWTLNYNLSFKKMLWGLEEKNSKKQLKY